MRLFGHTRDVWSQHLRGARVSACIGGPWEARTPDQWIKSSLVYSSYRAVLARIFNTSTVTKLRHLCRVASLCLRDARAVLVTAK